MRAAYINGVGPADVIRYGHLSAPRPGPHDVLVNTEMTTVNHVDTAVRAGTWRAPLQFPFVVGRDLVGTVAETGSAVSGFRAGDRVWSNSLGHAGRQGTAAELALAPADRLYHLPDGVDPADAAALAHPAATAHLALFTHGGLRPGHDVVVIGAGGNVGSALVTLAVDAGAQVIAVAGPESTAYVRELGADRVVDHRSQDVPAEIRRALPDGAALWVDAAGSNDMTTAVDLLGHRGRMVVLAGMRGRPVLPTWPLFLKDCSVTGFGISQATTTELSTTATALNRLMARGVLRPRAIEVLPLEAAAEAHRRVEAGETKKRRILLHVGESD